MQKVIRDGNVAVIYSPGYGAGWSTWSVPEEGIFHPALVEAIERNASEDEIVELSKKLFGDENYYGGAGNLCIEWIPVGTAFRIDEYDGAESIEYIDRISYYIA